MPIVQRSCAEIAARLAEGSLRLVDVRTEGEWERARVEGSELLTEALLAELEALPKDAPLAFLCHHGVRSQGAASYFAERGFTELSNAVGGIEAWSLEVDPSVPRY